MFCCRQCLATLDQQNLERWMLGYSCFDPLIFRSTVEKS